MNEAAENLVKRLKAEGFTIQRYDSISTNSIYLKLDYGMCNSIRISDHKGKQHLAYRYNLLTICPKRIMTKDTKGMSKYYFPLDQWEVLIRKILYDKQQKIENYGANSYYRMMEANFLKKQNQKGFWQSAKIV